MTGPEADLALSDVLSSLDATILRVTAGFRGVATAVRDVVIHDPSDPHDVAEGAIVLGIGVSPAGAGPLLERLGRAGAAALVLRADADPPPSVTRRADRSGVSLVLTPSETAWEHLFALLRTALAESRSAPWGDAIAVGDLFAFADAVAGAIDAPVTIEDPQWRVLAYSNLDQPIDEVRRRTILGRSPALEWQEWLVGARIPEALRSGHEVLRLAPEGVVPRLVAPIRAGSEFLGSIWAAEGATTLGAEAEAELLRAADLATVHLIAHRADENVKRRTRATHVREMLEGRLPEGLRHSARRRARAPMVAMVFDGLPDEEGAWTGDPDRILSVLTLLAEDADRNAMCALLDRRLWAIVPGETGSRTGLAHRVVERVERSLGARLVAGVGSAAPSPADLPTSRLTAEWALAVAHDGGGENGVADIAHVRGRAVLVGLLDLALEVPAFAEGRAQSLLEHDRDRGTSYVLTLRVFLDAHGDIPTAARRLSMHPNSFRYRLRRLQEISGIDMTDPDERLVVAFQLRMLERA